MRGGSTGWSGAWRQTTQMTGTMTNARRAECKQHILSWNSWSTAHGWKCDEMSPFPSTTSEMTKEMQSWDKDAGVAWSRGIYDCKWHNDEDDSTLEVTNSTWKESMTKLNLRHNIISQREIINNVNNSIEPPILRRATCMVQWRTSVIFGAAMTMRYSNAQTMTQWNKVPVPRQNQIIVIQ